MYMGCLIPASAWPTVDQFHIALCVIVVSDKATEELHRLSFIDRARYHDTFRIHFERFQSR
jgi:hypothetical protein